MSKDQGGVEKPDCAICNLVSGAAGTPVFSDDHWVLGMLEGLEAPGWLVLAQRRHGIGAVGMTDAEAISLGPVLKLATTAIEEVTGAERVYVVAYGENSPHWHLLLIPRGSDHPIEQRQAAIWGHRAEYVDPDRAYAVAADVGRALDLRSAGPADPAVAG
jgi:diadenosine tetraphosphate (Ap4A) HIT family hydrolase